MTVFVGPNNSGKSLVLREIEDLIDYFDEDDEATDSKILESIEPRLPDMSEVERLLLSRQIGSDAGYDDYFGALRGGRTRIGKPDFKASPDSQRPAMLVRNIDLESTVADIRTAKSSPAALTDRSEVRASTFGSFILLFTLRLDGSTRLVLTEPRRSGDLRNQAQNHLWSLLQDNDAREHLREITHDAFGRYFLIDPNAMQRFQIKMS